MSNCADAVMTPQSMRKRTLDALEKRFTVAKAELLQEQEKNKKQCAAERSFSNSITSIPVARSTKRPISLHSTASSRDGENLVYRSLSHDIDENLLKSDITQREEAGQVIQNIWHDILLKGDSARKYVQGGKNLKIDNSILLDNLVRKHASSGVLFRGPSSTQKKALGSLSIPQKFQKFVSFGPMHDMWKEYMAKLLENVGENQAPRLLLNADLHGALILVVECKVVSFSGVRGIVIRETAETFCLITKEDKIPVVPKKGSVFIFQAGLFKITLIGEKLAGRDFCS